MGLAERKVKQRIGDDPRNTKWAKNESNPGFKILSSMGWSPATKFLGASSNSLEPVRTNWKRLPGSTLPVIKSTTGGLGSNPSQVCSSSYLFGAPRFVQSSQSMISVETVVGSSHSSETDADRSAKVSIVATGGANGGGFDDLLSRLNQSNKIATATQPTTDELKPIEENEPVNDSFVLISSDESVQSVHEHRKERKIRSILIQQKHKPNGEKKRVRILDFCHDAKHALSFENDSKDPDQQPPKLKKSKKNRKHTSEQIQRFAELKANQVDSDEKVNNQTKKSNSLISNITQLKKPEEPCNENKNQHIGATPSSGATSIRETLKISRPMNPRVASRAKYIRSKQLATSANAATMAEILGIPPPTIST